MKRVTCVFCILFLCQSSMLRAASEADKAKKKLEKLGLALNAESFLNSIDDVNYEIVDAFLKAGIPVNARDKRGRGALHYSGEGNDIRVTALLIKAGADVNAKDEDGDTPVLKIAAFGRNEIIKSLLAAGADPNAVNENGETPLMKAGKLGQVETVRLLMQAGADVNAADEMGNTPLIAAASLNRKSMQSLNIPEQNFVTVIQELIAAGADVKAITSNFGTTALIEASEEGHTEIVKALLAAGADVRVKSKVDELTALTSAARHGHTEIVSLLIAAGADVNAKDRIGRTAAEWGADYPEVLQLLKAGGAKVPKTAGKPAANVSPEEKEAALNVLKARGIEFTDDAFMHSVKDGDIEAVQLFLSAGMRPDVKDDRDGTTTALIYAVTMNRTEVALALIKAGANVDAKDINGSTPLIWIAGNCRQSELVKALIAAGANVNAKAAGGATPLMMAQISNCAELATLLKKAGAK